MSLRGLIARVGQGLFAAASMGMENEFPFSRFGMYRSIRNAAKELSLEGPCLSISNSMHLCKVMQAPAMEFTDANYPAVSILDLPYADESFGLVVSDQVFEHIEGLPSIAMKESLRVLKPGGWAIHTTCFHTAYHGPGDYWRFSPEGLEKLGMLCGAARTMSGSGGHPLFALTNVLGWTRMRVPVASWHPLHWLAGLHRPSYATMVWVMVQRAPSS